MRDVSGALADVLPQFEIAERHARRVQACPEATEAAWRALTLRDVPLMTWLFAARSLPGVLSRRGPALPTALDEPLLDQFLARGFTVLREQPGQEIVVGVIGQMWRPGGRVVRPFGLAHFTGFVEPGFVKAALSFRFTADGSTTQVVTETRAHATDAAAQRAFARYWLLIGPFSGLVRRIWLRGLAARAESGRSPSSR